MVKRKGLWVALLCAALSVAVLALVRPPHAGTSPMRARLMAFLQRTMGWQGLTGIKVLSISPPGPSGLYAAKVELSRGAQHVRQTLYITPNTRYILLGQLSPMNGDPWRGIREKLRPGISPSEGPADAPVTIYEFSDLECPFCKQENGRLQRLVGNMPGKVRVIFKYYPLVNIHPWAMQAAIAAACVTQHNRGDFWPFEEAVFDHQADLDAANAARRLRDFALDSGTPEAFYNRCIQSPAPRKEVAKTIALGHEVGVKSTPTLYMNGRPINGAIPYATLAELAQYEAKIAPDFDHGIQTGAIKGKQCGLCKAPPPLPHKHSR